MNEGGAFEGGLDEQLLLKGGGALVELLDEGGLVPSDALGVGATRLCGPVFIKVQGQLPHGHVFGHGLDVPLQFFAAFVAVEGQEDKVAPGAVGVAAEVMGVCELVDVIFDLLQAGECVRGRGGRGGVFRGRNGHGHGGRVRQWDGG